jgi:hypothetical protein
MSDTNRSRSRLFIDLAICSGALSLVLMAFSVALWADWIIEINEDGGSGATGDILGRQLEMLALGAIGTATSIVALVIRNRPGDIHVFASVLGFLSGIFVFTLVGLHWRRGFYYHLEHSGVVVTLGLVSLQAALLIASSFVQRAPKPPH